MKKILFFIIICCLLFVTFSTIFAETSLKDSINDFSEHKELQEQLEKNPKVKNVVYKRWKNTDAPNGFVAKYVVYLKNGGLFSFNTEEYKCNMDNTFLYRFGNYSLHNYVLEDYTVIYGKTYSSLTYSNEAVSLKIINHFFPDICELKDIIEKYDILLKWFEELPRVEGSLKIDEFKSSINWNEERKESFFWDSFETPAVYVDNEGSLYQQNILHLKYGTDLSEQPVYLRHIHKLYVMTVEDYRRLPWFEWWPWKNFEFMDTTIFAETSLKDSINDFSEHKELQEQLEKNPKVKKVVYKRWENTDAPNGFVAKYVVYLKNGGLFSFNTEEYKLNMFTIFLCRIGDYSLHSFVLKDYTLIFGKYYSSCSDCLDSIPIYSINLFQNDIREPSDIIAKYDRIYKFIKGLPVLDVPPKQDYSDKLISWEAEREEVFYWDSFESPVKYIDKLGGLTQGMKLHYGDDVSDEKPPLKQIHKIYLMSVEGYRKTPFFLDVPWKNYEFLE